MTPLWFIGAIAALELGACIASVFTGRWLDALYWFGVTLINVVLFVRAAQ